MGCVIVKELHSSSGGMRVTDRVAPGWSDRTVSLATVWQCMAIAWEAGLQHT